MEKFTCMRSPTWSRQTQLLRGHEPWSCRRCRAERCPRAMPSCRRLLRNSSSSARRSCAPPAAPAPSPSRWRCGPPAGEHICMLRAPTASLVHPLAPGLGTCIYAWPPLCRGPDTCSRGCLGWARQRIRCTLEWHVLKLDLRFACAEGRVCAAAAGADGHRGDFGAPSTG